MNAEKKDIINVVLSKEDIGDLLDMWEFQKSKAVAQQQEARQALAEADAAIAAIDKKISDLRARIAGSSKPSEYPRNGTWNERIAFVLNLFQRPVPTYEIIDAIAKYQPEIDRKKITNSVYATISQNLATIYMRDSDKVRLKEKPHEAA